MDLVKKLVCQDQLHVLRNVWRQLIDPKKLVIVGEHPFFFRELVAVLVKLVKPSHYVDLTRKQNQQAAEGIISDEVIDGLKKLPDGLGMPLNIFLFCLFF